MKPSSELFSLIHSLNRTEKMYFKKYSRLHVRGEQNQYTLLFDAIEKQKEHDEEKLLQQFSQYGFARNFPVMKNYLYEQVLYALESYHHSVHAEVRSLLHRAEILCEKGLYKQAHKTVLKAKQIAREQEMYWALLEVYRKWELTLAIRSSDRQWVSKIDKEEREVIFLLENTRAYRDLNTKIVNLYTESGIGRNKNTDHEVEKLLKSKYLRDESLAKTFDAKIRYYETHAFCAQVRGNMQNAYLNTKKVIQLYESEPHKIRTNLSPFILCLNNALAACIGIRKFNEAPLYLDKLKKIPDTYKIKSPSLQTRLFCITAINHLGYYNNTGDFQKAVSILRDYKKELTIHELLMSDYDKVVLFCEIAAAYFGADDFKLCLYWLNRIRNEVPFSFRIDMECFLRLFYIILHYEAGNIELLPSLIQSAYRFLKKKERLYPFEKFAIEFLRRMPDADTPEKLIHAMQKLLSQIKPLAKDSNEKGAFENFDYISWLESKIQNRPFAEVVRGKAGTASR